MPTIRTSVFKKSRSIAWLRINENDDGSLVFFASLPTVKLIDFHFPLISQSSPTKWKDTKRDGIKSIWIPGDKACHINLDEIKHWADLAINQRIWINTCHPINYCVAADFNFTVVDGKLSDRTQMGNAEYWLKYHENEITKEERSKYVAKVCSEINCTFDLLPISAEKRMDFFSGSLFPIISPIPANRGEGKLAWRLARYIARVKELPFITPHIIVQKPEIKNLDMQKKIQVWTDIYKNPNAIDFPDNIQGRNIVIIDDLYQSGATMQAYANFLKSRGAAHICALVCIKSMRDSDNK